MPDRYDVIVLGLGAMGSATARHLARRGASVLGLEQFGPVHDRGSSHGDSRIVRTAYFERPDYVPLLRRTYDLWDELATDIGHPLFIRTGALMIGQPESGVVRGTLASVERWGLAHQVLDTAQLHERYPQFGLRDGDMAVFEEDAGYVNPESAVRAHLDLAARDGAQLRFDVRVTGWRLDGDGVLVEAGGEQLHARRLVLSAGAWTALLAPGLGVALRVGRRVMHYLQPTTDASSFAPERFPVYLYEIAPGDEIYGVPLVGAESTGVKVGFHHRGENVDPDTVDRVVSPRERDEMRAVLADRIPGLAGPHVAAQVCLYTLTPDEHFVIDRLPGTDSRVAIACGFSGHGFKFAPVVGQVLADLVLDGHTDAPIGFLSATRFAAGAAQ